MYFKVVNRGTKLALRLVTALLMLTVLASWGWLWG
jgi:hypothetical protein